MTKFDQKKVFNKNKFVILCQSFIRFHYPDKRLNFCFQNLCDDFSKINYNINCQFIEKVVSLQTLN